MPYKHHTPAVPVTQLLMLLSKDYAFGIRAQFINGCVNLSYAIVFLGSNGVAYPIPYRFNR